MKIHKFKLLSLSLTIGGLCQNALAEEFEKEVIYSPFAKLPFHLDNKSRTTGGTVKPNVYFLVDDSFSMTGNNDTVYDYRKWPTFRDMYSFSNYGAGANCGNSKNRLSRIQ